MSEFLQNSSKLRLWLQWIRVWLNSSQIFGRDVWLYYPRQFAGIFPQLIRRRASVKMDDFYLIPNLLINNYPYNLW